MFSVLVGEDWWEVCYGGDEQGGFSFGEDGGVEFVFYLMI